MNAILFGILPYVVFVLLVVGVLARLTSKDRRCKSISAPLIERRFFLWGAVPFHLGLGLLLALQVLYFLLPQSALVSLHSAPAVSLAIQIVSIALGALALVGLVDIGIQAGANPQARGAANGADVVFGLALALWLITGILTVLYQGLGGAWFGTVVSPWLWSLFKFSPDPAPIATLPFLARLHFLGAILALGCFAFTRMGHLMVVPNAYLVRSLRRVLKPSAQAGA